MSFDKSPSANSLGTGSKPWYHKHIGRMETEKLLLECREDGAFLIRESDTVKGAYVLSTIYQQRIHHYRIIPNEERKLCIQAQQGVQKKLFTSLEEMVQYYSQPKRGLVCGLTTPISQQKEEEPDDESDADDEPEEVSRERNIVSKFLLASLGTVDTSRVDDVFLERMRLYLTGDVSNDMESMVSPAPQLTYLKQLFGKESDQLHQQLDRLMAQVDLVQGLFERAGGAKDSHTKKRRSKYGETDMDTLGFKLTECADSLQNLETTAFQMLRELSVSLTGVPAHSGSLSQPAGGVPMANGDEDQNNEEISFDVKIEGAGLAGKKNVTIVISLRSGTLTFCKPGESHGTTFDHPKVLQLVKSRSRDQRLGILLEGQSRKDYLFGSMQAREHFCQLIQLVRNRMRADEDQDSISVFVGTWNMGDAMPPSTIDSWFRSMGLGKTLPPALAQPHDIYAIGGQECSISEREWSQKIKTTLKNLYDIDYEKLVVHTLWGIRLTIFVKPEHSKKITHLQVSQVRTGIGNALGNKGAVGISFYFGNVSLCFVNSHLTSGIEKCSRRNQNYHDILKGMGALKHKRLNQFDLTNQFHHLFFFGDLNYRVDLSAPDIVEYAKKLDHYAIYLEDQLRKDKEKKKIFVAFDEAPILFPPTYRFSKGRRTLEDYVWVKQKRSGIRINVPSYCDRVLWKSYPGLRIGNTSYGCTSDIMTSDHSPVFATFQIGGVKQYVSEVGKSMPATDTNTFIIVDSLKAKVLTNSRTSFYLEAYSPCFEGFLRSGPNNDAIESHLDGYVRPVWVGTEHVLRIKPIFTEQEFLEQQHLLLMLKSHESDEPYAECCLSLLDLIGPNPVNVKCELIHQGLSVGEMDIWIHVTLDHYRQVEDDQANIYSDMNFITAELEESSLDFNSKLRSRSSNSESETGLRKRVGSVDTRPKLPLPRRKSSSEWDRPAYFGRRGSGQANTGTMAGAISAPPPLPSRRRDQPKPLVPAPYTGEMVRPSQDPPRPVVPARRTESFGPRRHERPETLDGQSVPSSPLDTPASQLGPTNPGPPIPVKRARPRPNSGGASKPLRLPSRSSTDSQKLSPMKGEPPPLPPKSPEPNQQQPPVVHPRVRSRPLSTVEKLLDSHGLQHFAQRLVSNGYDDVHFVAEVSDEELKEIGISSPADRAKLLGIFSSYAH